MKVESFLPTCLLKFDRDKPWSEWLAGSVLFADVSGFTPMSEALSVLGAEGAEILTDILNRYFASMIGILRAHGGQVMKFGGDAILCFFPENGDWHMRSEAEACLSPLSGGGRQTADGERREKESETRNSKLETPATTPLRRLETRNLKLETAKRRRFLRRFAPRA